MPFTEELAIGAGAYRLHAQRWGSAIAPLAVGLPGLSGSVKNFEFLAQRICGDSVQLVALDLRGRGYSGTTPRGTYGWENHALDAFAVAEVTTTS